MILFPKVIPEDELRLFDEDPRFWKDGFCQPNITADHRASSDNSLPSQYRRTCVNDHIILYGRMALFAAQLFYFLFGKRKGAECNPLVDSNPVTDIGSLANNYPNPMVNKKALSDATPG